MRRLLVLAAVVVLAAGCRSDGGIDRSGNVLDLEWSTSCIARHFAMDVAATEDHIAAIAPALESEFTDSWTNMQYTLDLYLENDAAKAGYVRYERRKR